MINLTNGEDVNKTFMTATQLLASVQSEGAYKFTPEWETNPSMTNKSILYQYSSLDHNVVFQ